MTPTARGWWRIGAGVLLVLVSGCAAWIVPVVAVSWPIIAPSPPPRRAPAATGPHLVRDDGRGWDRVLLDSTGRVLEDGHPMPERVGVRWRIPIEVTGEIQAVVGLSPRGCQIDPVPLRWQLRSTSGVLTVGELWLAPERQYPSAEREDRRTLAPGALEMVRGRVGLSPVTPMRWLAIVPGAGRYWVDLVWETLPTVRAEQIWPCVDSWVPVPLAQAVAATQARGALPDTNALGAGMAAPLVERSSDEPRALAPSAPSASDTSWYATLRTTLGLLGQPAYDLMRLHQAALDLDVAPAGPPRAWSDRVPSGTDPAVGRALSAWRAAALDALRRGPIASQVALCDLVAQGLAARPLRVWQDEATVPVGDARACRDRR